MNVSQRRFLPMAVGCLVAIITTGCAPNTFVRQSPGWKTIEFHSGLVNNYDEAWQMTVDTIARSWDIEILDKGSGYLRTAWI
jgi:hypothetical protein